MWKIIKRLIIFVVVVLLLLVIGVIVLINLTPKNLKFADKKIINEKSCVDLGIDDTKFITMIKDIRKITKAKDVVKNPIKAEDESAAYDIFNKAGFTKGDSIDYESIYNTGLDQNAKFYFTYDDTTMAYVLNNSVSYLSGDAEIFKELNLTIEEVTFDGKEKEMRVVFGADITKFKDGIESNMPGFLAKWIGIPDKIYAVSYFKVDVTSEGKLVLDHKDVRINDVDNVTSKAILKALSSEDCTVESLNDSFGDAIEEAVSYLGKVGTADSNNGLVTGNISYGISGYQDGKICLIAGAAV